MITSALDSNVVLDDAHGAISVIVTSSGSAGHSLVAIEYVLNGVYHNVVADLVPLPDPSFKGHATQTELIKGSAGDHALKTKIRILGQDTGKTGASDIKTKVGRAFTSRTWQRPVSSLNEAMMQIGIDKSASTDNPGYDAYKGSPHLYQFMGQSSMGSPKKWGQAHGINCGNWARKILELAGVTGMAGLIWDIPRFQAVPGWTEWITGFVTGIGSGLRARL